MKPAEIEIKVALARKEMQYWQEILNDRRCGNCMQYNPSSGMCGKYEAVPPEGAKQPGCEDWEYDEIPF
jgi:hypothetical protein